jgi:H/ACA ribonucleoprotein complex non-core subunit NAF1
MDFRTPSLIPQDLQLIRDIVGDLPPHKDSVVSLKVEDDSILSSDDEDATSEKEVEADILRGLDDEEDPIDSSCVWLSCSTLLWILMYCRVSSDDSDDESSSSNSDSESEKKGSRVTKRQKELEVPGDEDDDLGGGADISPEQMRTKNEVGEINVVIPDADEVGEDEVLEKVGEVMSIIDKVVIVKGIASQVQNRGSEKALDSDTLLVFEDRKVLGYVSMHTVKLHII